jgi:hypothetical protein
MTAPTDYGIGTTSTTATLASIGLINPQSDFFEYVESVELANGKTRGFGLPYVEWHFGYMTAAQYDVLRGYCAGSSVDIYIDTPDKNNDFKRFSGKLKLPQMFSVRAGRRLDVPIKITHLVEISTS